MCARKTPLLAAALMALGCGTDGGAAIDQGADTVDQGGAADVGTTPAVYAVNVVDAAGATEVVRFLRSEPSDLAVATSAFYAQYGDDYDFLYLFPGEELSGAVSGRYDPVRHGDEPAIGLPGALDDTSYGSAARLQGVIALNLSAAGNGPTLHETLHRWGTFTDGTLGFGCDATDCFGAHWGVAGTDGQHGGFDRATLVCAGTTSAPPCAPGPGGRFDVEVAPFGPGSNGGDGKAYADIELYLMGLVPLSDVRFPILYLEDAMITDTGDPFVFDVSGVREIRRAQWTAAMGEQSPRPMNERAFRAAFVVVTASPASQSTMNTVARWARIFGDVEDSTFLLSFADATGNRATMDVSITQ